MAASFNSFVISWTHRFSATDFGIDAERFVIPVTVSGGVISAGVPVGQGIFGVNTDTNVEDHSSVAMSPDGIFVIAYERQFSGSDWDILASQYNGSGGFLRSVTVNGDGNAEHNPSVSMENFGNIFSGAVIAYQEFVHNDYGIYANRLSSSGVVGSRITVRDFGGVNETNPSVAAETTGGRFAVAYDTSGGVQVTETSGFDTVLETHELFTGFDPALSIDGSARYLVTYTRFNSLSGHNDIFSRRDFLS